MSIKKLYESWLRFSEENLMPVQDYTILLPAYAAEINILPPVVMAFVTTPEHMCEIIQHKYTKSCIEGLRKQGRINDEGLVKLTTKELNYIWPSASEEPNVDANVLKRIIKAGVHETDS